MVPLSDHPPANGFNDSEVAREAARLQIALLNTEHPIASTVDAISAGRSTEMSYRDMAHLAGVTENTLRKRMANSERKPDQQQLELAVRICLVHAAEALPMPEIAARLGLHEEQAIAGARGNEDAGFCVITGLENGTTFVTSLPAATAALRAFINRHYMSEPERFTVVLSIGQLDPHEVQRALDEIDPTGDLGVLYQSDVLATPEEGNGELLLRIAAPSPSAAATFAAGPWHSILEKISEPASAPPVIDIVPPGNRRYSHSPVLAAFFDQIQPTETTPASTIEAYRAAYLDDSDEATLNARCLQAAARAVRRAAGNQREPQLVSSGGTAFSEGSIASQLRLTKPLEQIQKPAVSALFLGADRLGPIPAGGLAHFKSPSGNPHIVESVSPTAEDRVAMASLSGQAVSASIAHGVMSIEEAVKPVIAPSKR